MQNEVIMLMSKAIPQEADSLQNLHMEAKKETTDASRKAAKSLTQTYTSNTSLVAILIATITFAAAFTLPGGYSNGAGSEGLPTMSKKFAFQTFLTFGLSNVLLIRCGLHMHHSQVGGLRVLALLQILY